MKCSECGAELESRDAYHTRPDNLAACPGPKAEKSEAKVEKPVRKPRSKK